jgi:Tfp pilus assembly protein PilN
MSNINFVPDDYVQGNESRRANLMCLVLFSVVMAGLGGSFVTIKIRQKACSMEESLVNGKMARMQESIAKFEELQTKRKEMMKTALTTAELLEPVPRSVVLASLTNSLPTGVSLTKLHVVQEEERGSRRRPARSKYSAARGGAATDGKKTGKEREDTNLEIEGIAPSDIQVADYMEALSTLPLLSRVALVESVEKKTEDALYRHFKLTAELSKEVHLTKEDVDGIKSKAERSTHHF